MANATPNQLHSHVCINLNANGSLRCLFCTVWPRPVWPMVMGIFRKENNSSEFRRPGWLMLRIVHWMSGLKIFLPHWVRNVMLY